MSSAECLAVLGRMFEATMYVAGPLLVASLVVGLLVGVAQTATQVNEPSVSFLLKTAVMVAVLATMGTMLVEHLMGYAKDSFSAIAQVVR